MKDILQKLEGSAGIDSALVMTLDGVVIVAHPAGEETERVAAFVSAMLLSIEVDAETLGFESLRRVTLWAGTGRLVVVPIDQFVLVLVADADTNLSFALMEVPGLAKSLSQRSKIEIEA